ncbi:hypothetical protein [Streptomyces sp. NPDC056660]|uniref:hypothetical protein n=1 Tax=Streptomyces sp. NPDC056660 TaxID=3345897 RepID=UPI0036948079
MEDGREHLDREQTIDRLEEFQKASVRAIEARGYELKGESYGAAVFTDKENAGRPRETLRFIDWNKIQTSQMISSEGLFHTRNMPEL